MTWLLGLIRAVSVWHTMYIGTANKKQKETLRKLKDAGLYKGTI